jgi:thiol-disulfide isomerase/thioredoxin
MTMHNSSKRNSMLLLATMLLLTNCRRQPSQDTSAPQSEPAAPAKDAAPDKPAVRSPIVDKPSPDWQTTDFAGKTYSMQDFRGKVVVMDFWYRACIWCARVMPQVKAVAEHFAGQNVAVLGMNVDEDPADAEYVIKKMELTYPNLKAWEIRTKYGVRYYPTLLIIDPNGIVKDFYVGYSPTLRDDLITKVKELLPAK